jgi:hypothetical protein
LISFKSAKLGIAIGCLFVLVNIRLSYEPLYGRLLGDALHSRIGDFSWKINVKGEKFNDLPAKATG